MSINIRLNSLRTWLFLSRISNNFRIRKREYSDDEFLKFDIIHDNVNAMYGKYDYYILATEIIPNNEKFKHLISTFEEHKTLFNEVELIKFVNQLLDEFSTKDSNLFRVFEKVNFIFDLESQPIQILDVIACGLSKFYLGSLEYPKECFKKGEVVSFQYNLGNVNFIFNAKLKDLREEE